MRTASGTEAVNQRFFRQSNSLVEKKQAGHVLEGRRERTADHLLGRLASRDVSFVGIGKSST